MLRAPTGALRGGEVRFNDRYAWEGTDYAPLREVVPLARYATDGAIEYWSADLSLTPPRIRYRFGFDTAEGRRWFGWDGLRNVPAPRGAFEFAYVREGDMAGGPEWARGATFYQVFPERFARSSSGHRRGPTSAWDGPVDAKTFLGGDLDGVVEHLDHIASLSVDGIYLTPVFTSPSSHKYDTSDYFNVDPDFGGNDALRRLVAAAHARGIRVVLDGVFNHAGAEWPPFVDARKNGAASEYANWFYWRDSRAGGLPYETWATNVASMPKLRTSGPALRDLICRVGRFWVEEFGVDGWRLDVANEVDHALWRAFRTAVREGNKDAFLFGEIWDWALPWLRGDQFDSTMNYPLRTALLTFARDADGHALLDGIDRLRAMYPEPIHHLLYNLLGSHDENRPLTELGGDKARLAVAVGLLYALPGVVSVYQGDEIGMIGEREDHGNRRGMVWEPARQDARLLDIHRRLGRLRRSQPALKIGAYERLVDDGSIVAFARTTEAERLVVVANAGESEVHLKDTPAGQELGPRPRLIERIAYSESATRAGTIAARSVEIYARDTAT